MTENTGLFPEVDRFGDAAEYLRSVLGSRGYTKTYPLQCGLPGDKVTITFRTLNLEEQQFVSLLRSELESGEASQTNLVWELVLLAGTARMCSVHIPSILTVGISQTTEGVHQAFTRLFSGILGLDPTISSQFMQRYNQFQQEQEDVVKEMQTPAFLESRTVNGMVELSLTGVDYSGITRDDPLSMYREGLLLRQLDVRRYREWIPVQMMSYLSDEMRGTRSSLMQQLRTQYQKVCLPWAAAARVEAEVSANPMLQKALINFRRDIEAVEKKKQQVAAQQAGEANAG